MTGAGNEEVEAGASRGDHLGAAVIAALIGFALWVPAYFFLAFWWIVISGYCDQGSGCEAAPVLHIHVAYLAAGGILCVGLSVAAFAYAARTPWWRTALVWAIKAAAAVFALFALLSLFYEPRIVESMLPSFPVSPAS